MAKHLELVLVAALVMSCAWVIPSAEASSRALLMKHHHELPHLGSLLPKLCPPPPSTDPVPTPYTPAEPSPVYPDPLLTVRHPTLLLSPLSHLQAVTETITRIHGGEVDGFGDC